VFAGERFGRGDGQRRRWCFHHRYVRLSRDADRPQLRRQIVLQTFPLIGNYGVIPADSRADPRCGLMS
jgi:carbamoylphosphate synthase small subunit